MDKGCKKIAVFRLALKRSDGYLALIAQINKASPSAGVIAEPFDPIAIANRNKVVEIVRCVTTPVHLEGPNQPAFTFDFMKISRDASDL